MYPSHTMKTAISIGHSQGVSDVLIVITGWSPTATSSIRRQQAFAALALASLKYETSLFLTSPKKLLANRRFSGWVCSAEDERIVWKPAKRRLTTNTVVYDAMYLRDLKAYRLSYRKARLLLMDKNIPVFNPVLPAKDELVDILTERPLRGGRLPNTTTQISSEQLLQTLDTADKLWLKPVYGSGGRNMAFIERAASGRFLVSIERHKNPRLREEMDKTALVQFFRDITRSRDYIAQEHIDLLSTPDGRKMDYRVTVQRHDNGAWAITAVTQRIGAAGSLLTNFHAGGSVRSLTESQKRQCGTLPLPSIDEGAEPMDEIEELNMKPDDICRVKQFALRVARRLQSHYATLGILGLDIGRTSSDELVVYDVNGRPGRDILTDDEVVQFMDSVAGYASYLYQNLRRNNG